MMLQNAREGYVRGGDVHVDNCGCWCRVRRCDEGSGVVLVVRMVLVMALRGVLTWILRAGL